MKCIIIGRMAAASLMFFLAIAPAFGSEAKGRQFALLIGVRKYDPNELRDLPYAEADMEALSKTLTNAGYQPEDVVLMTQSAAANNLRYAPEAGKIRRELKL